MSNKSNEIILTNNQQHQISIIEELSAENESKDLLSENQENLTILNEIDNQKIVETYSLLIGESSNSNRIETHDSFCQSSIKSSETICRICQIEDTIQNDDLIIACKCKGSLKFVHESCLLKWLTYNRKKTE